MKENWTPDFNNHQSRSFVRMNALKKITCENEFDIGIICSWLDSGFSRLMWHPVPTAGSWQNLAKDGPSVSSSHPKRNMRVVLKMISLLFSQQKFHFIKRIEDFLAFPIKHIVSWKDHWKTKNEHHLRIHSRVLNTSFCQASVVQLRLHGRANHLCLIHCCRFLLFGRLLDLGQLY